MVDAPRFGKLVRRVGVPLVGAGLGAGLVSMAPGVAAAGTDLHPAISRIAGVLPNNIELPNVRRGTTEVFTVPGGATIDTTPSRHGALRVVVSPGEGRFNLPLGDQVVFKVGEHTVEIRNSGRGRKPNGYQLDKITAPHPH